MIVKQKEHDFVSSPGCCKEVAAGHVYALTYLKSNLIITREM